MKYMFQLCIILLFCFLGELCHMLLPFPVPASVYGLVLLFAALCKGIVKLPQIRETGNFLTGIFQLLFIPAAAGVLELWEEFSGVWLPFLIASVPFTVLVMAASALTVEKIAGNTLSGIPEESEKEEHHA